MLFIGGKMDWITSLNNAITYVENHLTDDINLDQVSQVAYSSTHHFQTMFRMLTDMTITEYIRKRRLTLAVTDLAQDKKKVIDVAFKYGYETPESFTKAFKRYHGISPSLAKKGDQTFQALLPLHIQVTLKGALPMDYRIEKKEAMSFKGIKRTVSSTNGENFKAIPKFWNEFFKLETADMFDKHVGPLGYVGACYNNNESTETFDYMIGVEASDDIKGQTVDVLEIPESTWAVFTSVGSIPEAIQEVWQRIYQEFFPGTRYEHAMLPELEVYLLGDITKEDYKCEVWIPIIEK